MRLLGGWNWWAPAPLAALTAGLGFSHAETPEPSDWSGPDRRIGSPDSRPEGRRHDRRSGAGLAGRRPESAIG
jgi:hypothetical protein